MNVKSFQVSSKRLDFRFIDSINGSELELFNSFSEDRRALDGYYHISYKLLRAIQTKEKKRKFSLRYYDGKFYGVFCTSSSSNLYGSKSCVCHIVHKKAFQKSPKVMKSWFVMTQQYIINMFCELYLYYEEVKTYY